MNIVLSIRFNICFGCSKESLIEMVLLSTYMYNICFRLRNKKKIIYNYALLSRGLSLLHVQEKDSLLEIKYMISMVKCLTEVELYEQREPIYL